MRRSEYRNPCWVLTETGAPSPWGKSCRLDFSYIRSEGLRLEFQEYMWHQYRSGRKKPATLRQENCCFKYYEAWLHERGIDSLFRIGPADVDGFLTYLHVCVSQKTGRPLRLITQKHIYDTVRGIYHWYVFRRSEYVAVAQMFSSDVYRCVNCIVRTGYVEQREVTGYLQALEQEQNPCLRWGVKLLAMTGLAPGDLLGLRTDCIQNTETGNILHYYNRRKREWMRIPVSEACVQAVQALWEQTEELRRSAPLQKRQQLFLHRNKHGQVIVPSPDLFRYWMRCTQKERGEQNEQTVSAAESRTESMSRPMTATMLRCALIDDMRERKVPYMVIQELSGNPFLAERRSLL